MSLISSLTLIQVHKEVSPPTEANGGQGYLATAVP
jgi:hypothetical protein